MVYFGNTKIYQDMGHISRYGYTSGITKIYQDMGHISRYGIPVVLPKYTRIWAIYHAMVYQWYYQNIPGYGQYITLWYTSGITKIYQDMGNISRYAIPVVLPKYTRIWAI